MSKAHEIAWIHWIPQRNTANLRHGTDCFKGSGNIMMCSCKICWNKCFLSVGTQRPCLLLKRHHFPAQVCTVRVRRMTLGECNFRRDGASNRIREHQAKPTNGKGGAGLGDQDPVQCNVHTFWTCVVFTKLFLALPWCWMILHYGNSWKPSAIIKVVRQAALQNLNWFFCPLLQDDQDVSTSP